MNYKLIMLPNPILISDEEIKESDWFLYNQKLVFQHDGSMSTTSSHCEKIVAGIEGLPKLDLSNIAEEIGWVDVEKLAWETLFSKWDSRDIIEQKEQYALKAFIEGFKVAQSLNENKYSEEDIIDFYEWCDISDEAARFWRLKRVYPSMDGSHNSLLRQRRIELFQIWVTKRKPKEYNVEVEMEYWKNSKVYDQPDTLLDIPTPKITNNTIKVTKIK